MSEAVKLSGITWNHSRGFVPMVATAQRFSELHPDVEIDWQKRSLQEFADYPIQELVDRYDLLVIDHPFVGYAAAHDVLLPLDEHLPPEFLMDQARNSVGASHESYTFGGHQWALATDAATPVSSHRPDLIAKHGLALPRTWDDLIELARTKMVLVPAIAIDCLMNLYYLCTSQGAELFTNERFVDIDIGAHALEQLRELVQLCPPECLERNPIRTYDALAGGGEYAYCPFAYSYSNYGREGYAANVLKFGDVVSIGQGDARTTLGGTGLAVSVHCKSRKAALEYAQFASDPWVQRTLYVDNGGQPGHRSAWLSARANHLGGDFFKDTLETHDRAYQRPRYDGYLHFQDEGGPTVREYVISGGDPTVALGRLQRLFEDSLMGTDALAGRS